MPIAKKYSLNELIASAKYYFEKLGEIPVTNKFSQDFDIIIDALFGIGLNRPLNSDICDLINDMNSSNAIKIAVDYSTAIIFDIYTLKTASSIIKFKSLPLR